MKNHKKLLKLLARKLKDGASVVVLMNEEYGISIHDNVEGEVWDVIHYFSDLGRSVGHEGKSAGDDGIT